MRGLLRGQHVSEELSSDERARYARHLMLPLVGSDGQKRLRDGSVLVIGAGGLGSPALLYLTAAGVGRIGIVDDDAVEITNLQRQILHTIAAVGEAKVESARRRLGELNPEIQIEVLERRLSVENALEILDGWDVVIDGSDNFATRYTLSDACEILGIPWVFGSIHRFEGQVTVFNHEGGPNYRDLFPTAPPPELAPNCAEAGVLGVLPGLVGTIQATEALKLLLGIGEPLSGRLLTIDALSMDLRSLDYSSESNREAVTEMSEESITAACSSIVVAQEPQQSNGVSSLTPLEFMMRLDEGWSPFLLDVRRPVEEMIVSLPGTDLRITHRAVPKRSSEIPRDRDVVVYCRTGGRSDKVVNWLGESGWSRDRVFNLLGGIHLWSDTIDPLVPKY